MLTSLQRDEGFDQAACFAIRVLRRVDVRNQTQFTQMLNWVTHMQFGWTDTIGLAAFAETEESVIESALKGECPNAKLRKRIREAAIALLQSMVSETIDNELTDEGDDTICTHAGNSRATIPT